MGLTDIFKKTPTPTEYDELKKMAILPMPPYPSAMEMEMKMAEANNQMMTAGFGNAIANQMAPYQNALNNMMNQQVSGGQGMMGIGAAAATLSAASVAAKQQPRSMSIGLREITNGFLVTVGGKEHFAKELSEIGSIISSAWAGQILGE